MKRYRGGESAPRGIYLSLSTWEFVQLYAKAPVLQGGGEVRYLKVSAPLTLVAAPIAGLVFIIFLPLIGILWVGGLAAYKVGQGARALGRRILQPAAIGWQPGMAHLTRRGGTPAEEPPAEGAEQELAEQELVELEREIARRRQQGEE